MRERRKARGREEGGRAEGDENLRPILFHTLTTTRTNYQRDESMHSGTRERDEEKERKKKEW